MVTVPGDRLVLRSYSPAITIAGAAVVDPSPVRRARLDAKGRERLETLESGPLAARLSLLVGDTGFRGLRPEAAAIRLGEDPAALAEAASRSSDLVRVRDGRFLMVRVWAKVLDRVVGAVQEYGERHKLRHGVPKGELKSQLQRELDGIVFDDALEAVVRDGRLRAAADRLSLPEAGPSLTAEEARALEHVEQRLGASGFQVPKISEVMKELPPGVAPGEVVRHMVEAGRTKKEITADEVPWAEIEARVRAHFAQRPSLTMSEFKELLHVSRKYAVPILEHLDRTGLTRREGDLRAPGARYKQ